MRENKVDVLVISLKDELKNLIVDILREEGLGDKVSIHLIKDLDSMGTITPALVFMDFLDKKLLEEIKSDKRFIEARIVTTFSKDNKSELKSWVTLGIINYIMYPYDKDEIFITLNNGIQYSNARYDCKLKENQFDAILNNTPFMTWFKDIDSNYIKINDEFREHSGKDEAAITGSDDKFVWNGKIGERCREYDLIVMNERKRIVFDEIIPGKKGYRQFNIHKAPVFDEFNEVVGTIGIAKDITDLKNKDAKLDIILDNIPFGVWLTDIDGTILNANAKVIDELKMPRESIVGNNEFNVLDPKLHKFLVEEDKQIVREKKSMVFERYIENEDGYEIMEVHKSPVFDISNKIIGIVGLSRDITEIKQNQEYIKELAYTDHLTGLLNRRGLYEYIENEIDKDLTKLTVMFVDLDNFKKLNDSFGHYYGDKALKLIGKKLKSFCKGAKCARIGGDEFVIVWENFESKPRLIKTANKILALLRNEFKRGDRSIYISGSMGIVCGNDNRFDYEAMLLKGDAALYKAKEIGKNQYVFYTDKLEEELNFNLQIEEDLKNAVSNNEVVLNFQPQYTPERELVGFESLFRWKNKKYKGIPIVEIIKTIEKYDVMDDIGDYILRETFTFAKEINKKTDRKLVVSANISSLQLMGNKFVEKFKDIVEEVGVDPSLIGIEITETVLLQNISENIGKIEEIKNMGVTVSLDDFGTGYSSLNYLVKLPISKVKIDKSFIWGMSIGEEYIKLVNLIIDISHSLGLPVIAEGVESEIELDILKDMNIDLIQGYLFSEPLDKDEAEKLI